MRQNFRRLEKPFESRQDAVERKRTLPWRATLVADASNETKPFHFLKRVGEWEGITRGYDEAVEKKEELRALLVDRYSRGDAFKLATKGDQTYSVVFMPPDEKTRWLIAKRASEHTLVGITFYQTSKIMPPWVAHESLLLLYRFSHEIGRTQAQLVQLTRDLKDRSTGYAPARHGGNGS